MKLMIIYYLETYFVEVEKIANKFYEEVFTLVQSLLNLGMPVPDELLTISSVQNALNTVS
jgi:hypothetical protein